MVHWVLLTCCTPVALLLLLVQPDPTGSREEGPAAAAAPAPLSAPVGPPAAVVGDPGSAAIHVGHVRKPQHRHARAPGAQAEQQLGCEISAAPEASTHGGKRKGRRAAKGAQGPGAETGAEGDTLSGSGGDAGSVLSADQISATLEEGALGVKVPVKGKSQTSPTPPGVELVLPPVMTPEGSSHPPIREGSQKKVGVLQGVLQHRIVARTQRGKGLLD